MKKIAVLLGIMGMLCLTSCKEKMCRCSVLGDQNIRIISIDRGSCEDIRFFYYDRDGGTIEIYQDLTDSVLCTDYLFAGESTDMYNQ